MINKGGRPKKEKKKNKVLIIRMTEEEDLKIKKKLDESAYKYMTELIYSIHLGFRKSAFFLSKLSY